jgi:hypothetical protein
MQCSTTSLRGLPARGRQGPAGYTPARLTDAVLRAKLRSGQFDTRLGKLVEAAVVKELGCPASNVSFWSSQRIDLSLAQSGD